MILVTGATGHVGSAVIDNLLKKVPAKQIAALVRDASKAADLKARGVEICVGNYDDIDSLERAMQGVAKVLLISGTDEGKRLQQHRNVVEAAKKVGVQLIAYTSRNLRDPDTLANALMREHFQTEDAIKASGLPYAIFRNALYMDAIPLYVGGAQVFTTGIRLPAGQGRVAFALRSEQSEAIANALLTTPGESRVYKLTGGEAWSFSEVARALTELSSTPVAYTPLEPSAFATHMRERGIPDTGIRRIIDFMTDITHGQEDEVTSTMADLLGRKPVGLKEGLSRLFNL
jgi:NAD(P)H dehydrogenase (quinone)